MIWDLVSHLATLHQLCDVQIGNDNFNEVLAKIRGPEAIAEWQRLQDAMRPLAKAAVLMPPVAFR